MDESETSETAAVRSPAEEAVPTATSTTDLMSSSENMNNENREKELSAAAAEKAEQTKSPSAENVTYKEDGTAIYTDPATKFQYEWDKEKNEWAPSKSTESSSAGDPYENEHFRWCHETNKWIRKDTEFYKWNEETESWIPKTASSQVTELKDGVHTYTDKDGIVFFWDTEKNAWFPKIDDDFMAVYQMNYGFVDNTTEAAKPPVESDKTEKPDEEAAGSVESGGGAKKRKHPDQPKWFELPPEKNTKVYVTNLPLDTTEEEFAEMMSKYGMIIKDPQSNKLKIKLYREADGQLKGDALCHYIKVSVCLFVVFPLFSVGSIVGKIVFRRFFTS
jgi:HIV Tat-specific factor 1